MSPLAAIGASPSHLIQHVSNTDDTIAFHRALLDAEVTDDHTFGDPSLDAIFGRQGVVIRSTFIAAAGYRIHTIETLDVPRPRQAVSGGPIGLGLSGLSYKVDNLDALHQRAAEAGYQPTPIYEFATEQMQGSARLFFLPDPDGIRLEFVEYGD